MKRLPKILYIQKPRGGGSVVALYEMVQMLDKTKYDPVILCYEYNEYTRVLRQLKAKVIYLVKKEKAELNSVPQKTPSSFFAPLRKFKRLVIDDRRKSRQIAAIIKEQKIDLIHHNNDINESRQGLLANRKLRLPQICHYRSLKPYYNDLINRNIDYFMAKNVNFHIYISQAVEQHFTGSLSIKKNKGIVVRDIIDVKKFKLQPKNIALLDEFNFSPGDIVLTNIGRISRWKGQHVFINALAQVCKMFPNVKALVVGPSEPGVGDPAYLEELKRLVQKFDLQGNVILTGNRNDIPDILSITDIVVHSSIEPEPQGLVIVEALFYGKPVIVTDAGGAAELIINNQGGCKVEPGNVPELVAALEKLINCQLANGPCVHSTKRPAILSEFKPDQQITAIQNIYDYLLR